MEPSNVLIDIGDGRFRVSAGRLHVGSWALSTITAERTSIYKFSLDIGGEHFDFYPDDPSTFSDTIGATRTCIRRPSSNCLAALMRTSP